MRRRTRAASAAVALVAVVCAAMLAGCSQSSGSSPDRPQVPAPPASDTALPTPVPTSTLRIGTAKNPLRYAALGDSYSAGMGGGDETGKCRRSPHAYPHQLAASKTIMLSRFVACAGATTSDVLAHQIDALDPQIDLVTITIGGNDLDVAALPTACNRGENATCKAAVARSVALLHKLPAKLDKTYKAIAKAAPHARILVADYPLFYDLPEIDANTLGSDELSSIVGVDAAVASLDSTISNAVAKQRAAGTDIHFVDVSFKGHAINAKKPWFVLGGVDAYHPTKSGYARYAKTLAPLTR